MRPLRTRGAVAAIAAAAGGLAAALALLPPSGPAPTDAALAADTASAEAASGPWLTGYWHNFDNGSTTMPLSEVPAEYTMVAVAFADNLAGTPGGITFNLASSELGGYTEQQFKDDIAAMQAEGRKVVISVGGEKGHVDVTNPEQAAGFAQSAHALMQEYGFDGVDIDLEHGMNARYMEDALRDLRSRAGSGLVVTMAPQTIDFQAPSYDYYKLAESIPDILTIVNMQYYNSGSMMGCDQQVYSQGTVDFLTAQACIQLELGLRPDQVGLGLPATPQAAGGGHQPTSNVIAALDCLEEGTNCGSFTPSQPYGPIGGVMTWSINWDATNDYQFAKDISARLGGGGTGPTPSPTPSPSPDPSPSPTGSAEPCDAPAWDAGTVYTGGDRVAYEGTVYEARHWTRGDTPQDSQWGPWKAVGAC
ncbi:glycosyl hydrolase family 18 protein [Nocardiopsis suaedae]|uniref:chitinase n=1 Tax=Nocardiopsis suaedae TaxID=3018444 RepID=A0ABT4TLA7_9ACTN|nr:glycosyl hydrolase family 18 protein [Nocardiopsis suaedae]MDA2805496.1 glycosyl hydrolase family 18 protein [Nocardiopsis suaedae]